MLDYKIMYVSRTGNTQRLAVCIYQSLQQLGNGDIEEINCNTEPGKSHLLYVGFCVEKGDCPIEVQELLKKVHNRQIALFGTCGFGQSQEYYDRIVENETVDSERQQLSGGFSLHGKDADAGTKTL